MLERESNRGSPIARIKLKEVKSVPFKLLYDKHMTPPHQMISIISMMYDYMSLNDQFVYFQLVDKRSAISRFQLQVCALDF